MEFNSAIEGNNFVTSTPNKVMGTRTSQSNPKKLIVDKYLDAFIKEFRTTKDTSMVQTPEPKDVLLKPHVLRRSTRNSIRNGNIAEKVTVSTQTNKSLTVKKPSDIQNQHNDNDKKRHKLELNILNNKIRQDNNQNGLLDETDQCSNIQNGCSDEQNGQNTENRNLNDQDESLLIQNSALDALNQQNGVYINQNGRLVNREVFLHQNGPVDAQNVNEMIENGPVGRQNGNRIVQNGGLVNQNGGLVHQNGGLVNQDVGNCFNYTCGCCKENFFENSDLLLHLQFNHKQFVLKKRFRCAKCPAKFYKNRYLILHNKFHHK